MNDSGIAVVSQRVDVHAERGERRDALDQRLCAWIADVGAVWPVPMPNSLMMGDHSGARARAEQWVRRVQPAVIVLSGGNDIGACPERDATEHALLDYAARHAVPVLGICRGMQMMAVWAGASLESVEGHVGDHRLVAENCDDWPSYVNSFHSLGVRSCPEPFSAAARAEDGVIEAMTRSDLPWEGWMWHPERPASPATMACDRARFLRLLRA